MYQLRRLIANRLHYARVRVAEGVNAQSGDEIHIALPLDIKKKHALAAAQHDGVPVVGLQQKLPLAFGDLFKVIHRKFQFYRIVRERGSLSVSVYVISDTPHLKSTPGAVTGEKHGSHTLRGE